MNRLQLRPRLARIVLVVLVGTLSACHHVRDDDDDDKRPAQDAVALVSEGVVRVGTLAEPLVAYGVVEPSPDSAMPVVADAEGTVTRVLAKVGGGVHAGDPLVEVRASLQSHLDAERARIDVALSEKEVVRRMKLRDDKLGTNADVEAAEADLARAQAARNAVLGGATLGERIVRAPAAGVVRAVVVKPGDVVPAGAALLVLGTNALVQVRLGLEASDVDRVKPGAGVHVQALYGHDVEVDGHVRDVHHALDVDSHTADALVVLDKPAGLLAGARVRATVRTRVLPDALLVPRPTLVVGAGTAAVFVVREQKAHRVDVKVLLDDGVDVAVEGELHAGDVVVTRGASELADGMGVRTEDNAKHDDTKHNDTKHDDTKHDDTKHDDTKHDDTKHDDTKPEPH